MNSYGNYGNDNSANAQTCGYNNNPSMRGGEHQQPRPKWIKKILIGENVGIPNSWNRGA